MVSLGGEGVLTLVVGSGFRPNVMTVAFLHGSAWVYGSAARPAGSVTRAIPRTRLTSGDTILTCTALGTAAPL